MNRIKKELTLDKRLLNKINKLQSTIRNAGFECYMVGGSVRDLMLDISPCDFDFATNAHPEEIVKLFTHVVPTGIKHGTVTVFMQKEPFEVTTYRCDGKYVDGRRPEEVTFSDTLEEDIVRRDFTINGLAYDFESGEVVDYVDGCSDIKQRTIRTIGDAKTRLSEDGLRAYRACRLASKLDFYIEDETVAAIQSTLDISNLVSVERVRDEIMKIMASPKPSIGIDYLYKTGLLKLALPELHDTYGVEQNRFHTYDVYYHCVYSCDAASAEYPLVRFAALLHDIGKVSCRAMSGDDYTFYNHEVKGARMVKAIMRRLKFSNDETSHVVNLVNNHMFYYTNEWTDGAVRRFIRKVGLENLDDLIRLRMADRVGNGSRHGLAQPIYKLQEHIDRLIEEDSAFAIRDLNISGRDIMGSFEQGEGPVIGEVLNYLLELVLENPELNNNEDLMKQVAIYFDEKSD